MRRPHAGWDTRPEADKLHALHDAAARLAVRHGLDGVSLTDILRACGLDAAYHRRHYRDKPSLFTHLSDRHLCGLLGAVDAHGDAHGDQVPPAPDRLRILARAVLRAARAAPDAHRVVLMRLLDRSGSARGDLHARVRWLHAAVTEALEARLPGLRASPDRAAEAASDLLLLLAARALGGPVDDPASDAQADRVVAGILAGLRGFDKAPRSRARAA